MGGRAVSEHLEVIRPIFEGDEAEIREYHEENLAHVRRRADLLRCGQRALAPAQAARDAEEPRLRPHESRRRRRRLPDRPETPEKEAFSTHEATLFRSGTASA